MSITIEEGKRYVTQDGEVVGPFNWRFPNHVYPWSDTDTNKTYTVNGVYDTSEVSGNDLVREYIEPSIPDIPGPAATEDSVPVQHMDDWVTQDRVPSRPGIDQRQWVRPNGGETYEWQDAGVMCGEHLHGYELNGMRLELRCRRRDLPDIPIPAATEDSVPLIRQFETGATRNLDGNKLDYEGFFSPLAMKSFAEYMHSHRKQKDGTLRDADNWQKGIPLDVYMKSMWRHFMDVWSLHRGGSPVSPDTGNPVDMEEALNALMFNVQGYLHETLKRRDSGDV